MTKMRAGALAPGEDLDCGSLELDDINSPEGGTKCKVNQRKDNDWCGLSLNTHFKTPKETSCILTELKNRK